MDSLKQAKRDEANCGLRQLRLVNHGDGVNVIKQQRRGALPTRCWQGTHSDLSPAKLIQGLHYFADHVCLQIPADFVFFSRLLLLTDHEV